MCRREQRLGSGSVKITSSSEHGLPKIQTVEMKMKKFMIATVALAVAAQTTFVPAAQAGGRGIGIGLGVGLGAGLLLGHMQQQAYAREQMQRQQAMRAMQAQKMRQMQAMAEAKARAEAGARMQAEAKARAVAEAKAKAEAEAKLKAEAKAKAEAEARLAGAEPAPPPGKQPANQKADATLSSALVATEATRPVDEARIEEPAPKGKTKVADCRKFVPSLGMTITVPCN